MLSKSQFEVWVQFRVAKRSVNEIHDFFIDEYNIRPNYLIANLHLTIYHSRRPMFSLEECVKSCHFSVDTYDTRFMVLAPGGENPRLNSENPKDDLIPGQRKVGIRVKKSSYLRDKINEYREQLYPHETSKVLGNRKPSTNSRNAFGAKNFQPHISLLQSGSGIITDLTEVGIKFREYIPEIKFDKFIVQSRRNF